MNYRTNKIAANISILIITVFALDIYLFQVGAISLSEYEFNPKTGIRYGNIEDKIIFNEGFAIKSYNSEILYNKDKNTKNSFRIALIGDSYVKSDQVFKRQHFGQIIKNNLTIDMPINVLNYGYNGSDLKQMYITHKLVVEPTKPDLILYFISKQDFENNTFNDPLLPKIVENGNNLNIICDFQEESVKSYLATNKFKKHSSIVNLILNSTKQFKTNGLIPSLLGKFYCPTNSTKKNQSNKDAINTNKNDLEISPLHKKIIENIDKNKVIFVNIDQDKFSDNILFLFKKNNINLIELGPVINALIANHSNPYYWELTQQTGHWNKKAHQEIGLYISIELNKILSTTNMH